MALCEPETAEAHSVQALGTAIAAIMAAKDRYNQGERKGGLLVAAGVQEAKAYH